MKNCKNFRRAFTLIESLVVIAVVAVVLALSLPALLRARQSGRALQCQSHARTCATAIQQYATDSRETFPFFARRYDFPAFVNGGYELGFYFQAMHWPLVVNPYMDAGRLVRWQWCPSDPNVPQAFGADRAAFDRDYPPSYTHTADYFLSHTLYTNPAAWQPGGVTDPISVQRPVRTGDVSFPSQKGMLIETTTYHAMRGYYGPDPAFRLSEPASMGNAFVSAFVDGSVRSVPWSSFRPAYHPRGEHPQPVMMTLGGCRGVDL